MLVHQASLDQGESFLAKRWEESPSIADPERRLFAAFGLDHGNLRELVGPATWAAGVRALTKGHFIGRPVGDPLVMPGLFLVEGDRVLWQHEFAHAGDQPQVDPLVHAVREVLAGRASRTSA